MQESLAQTVDVETPELVVLSYTIAGLGSRLGAALIDFAISALLFIAVIVSAALLSPRSLFAAGARAEPTTAWALAVLVIMQFAILWGYYLLFEGLRDGQTPGKRVFRLRAVRDGGYSVGFAASAVRNLMRIVDLQPAFTYLVGIASVAFSRSGKRLGDIVAGTIVVRESLVRQPAVTRPSRRETPAATTALEPTRLSDLEFRLLERWAARRNEIDPDRRRQLTTQVGARLRDALPPGDASSEGARLMRLYTSEREARERGAPARNATGASRERYAIVTTRSPRWIAFASRLAEAQRRGLRALGETGVREFVEEYRALTADMARLRTAARGGPSDELFYLGRLVAGAHNLLYRDRRSTVLEILRFVAVEVPGEVRRSAWPIAIAAAFLFVPAAISYTAVLRHPQVASTFIPPQMLDRAEEGVIRARQGTGYIPDPQVFRPVMASQIIANNVQVTFAAFAFGITLGIGTLILLLLNGISLGGVFGLYASKGILPLLVAFVAPHGVLELSAICISAGGGLLIAAALLLPGDRTRRQALVENSRRAIRLIAASTLLLIVAGSLEGMVSPIPNWPLWAKLAVSATTLVLLAAYLRGGGPHTTSLREETPSESGAVLGL
ncbi:MAG TPA: stage II sporulation protein M [Gemmatimonadaceae bacterium]|nr:stage II sporulation protein M [Gemmatimonadaceae bacterium]